MGEDLELMEGGDGADHLTPSNCLQRPETKPRFLSLRARLSFSSTRAVQSENPALVNVLTQAGLSA